MDCLNNYSSFKGVIMMKVKRNKSIYGGVRGTSTGYTFDYTYDYPEDILDIVPPKLYSSSIPGATFWFGYKFKDHVSSKVRTDFIHFIKGIGEPKITQSELNQFISLPLQELNKEISTFDIDCVVYPVSSRSTIVKSIMTQTAKHLSRYSSKCSFELVKSAPTDIEFDWDLFEYENQDNPSYGLMVNHVNNYIMPKIHGLDYFSLARDIKPRYRPYIQNFLNFDDRSLKKLQSLHSENILVIDDIATSGSTLNEIVRILRSIDKLSNIYIFTLIGRD